MKSYVFEKINIIGKPLATEKNGRWHKLFVSGMKQGDITVDAIDIKMILNNINNSTRTNLTT